MPIDTISDEFRKRLVGWRRIRDLIAGESTLKEADSSAVVLGDKGSKVPYLIIPRSLEPEEALDYIERACYWNASQKSLSAYIGMITRKPIAIKNIPKDKSLEEWAENVDGNGSTLSDFAKQVLLESISHRQVGVMVDYENESALPILKLCPRENILEPYDTIFYKGKRRISRIRLLGSRSVTEDGDHWQRKNVKRITEIRIDGAAVVAQAYEQTGKDDSWEKAGEEQVLTHGNGDPFIPLALDRLGELPENPFENLVTASMGHYRAEAELGHLLHFTAMPIFWTKNQATDGEDVDAGGSKGISLQEDGDIGFASIDGNQSAPLENAVKRLENRIIGYGLQMLTNSDMGGPEAENTVRIRQTTANSPIIEAIDAAERTLATALNYFKLLTGHAGESMGIAYNRDLIDVQMSPQRMTELRNWYLSDLMPTPALFHNMMAGEMLPAWYTLEQFEEWLHQAGLNAGQSTD